MLTRSWLTILCLGLLILPCMGQDNARENENPFTIIPQPLKVEPQEGVFKLNSRTSVLLQVPATMTKEVTQVLQFLRSATGVTLQTRSKRNSSTGTILFESDTSRFCGKEGYRLEIDTMLIRIVAGSPAGFFYAVQSLLQLLPPEIYTRKQGKTRQWQLPCVTIADTPRFGWRGMHLDVCRHFFPKQFILTYLDMLALHKMNVFHWHLTDDQGWRIEIKKYPRLTKVGAWRVDREDQNWNSRDAQRPGEEATYGGFYTQKEIREIVKYAAQRNITIVPEIEMPAHATAALAAYPQYSCTGGPFTVPPGGVWPITDIFCAGNDSTFLFLENILSEVIRLFPGTFIHVGGDEADKLEWKRCPKCQARLQTERLQNEDELQSYFIRRIEKFLISKGKRLIGWDEILEGGLAPGATVMSWRGEEGGIAAARQNHDVVMTPGSHCYFDYYQGLREVEPLAIGGYIPLRKVYSFEPIPESLTVEQGTHILGAQANVWTEFIPTPSHAQYMTLPRMAAMAEVLWSPKSSRNWDDFTRRLPVQLLRYSNAGYNYASSCYQVSITPVADSTNGTKMITLSAEIPAAQIRYTLDGSDPSPSSNLYEKPFPVSSTSEIRAGGFSGNDLVSKVTRQAVLFHTALLSPVTLTYPYEKYGSEHTLTDGLRGSLSISDGKWQGFHQYDLDAVIDLRKETTVTAITAGFLQITSSWIFFPTTVQFEVATDTLHFVSVGTEELPVAQKNEEPVIKDIRKEFPATKARYIRVRGTNVGLCPEWHPGKGDRAWLFIDEIIVE